MSTIQNVAVLGGSGSVGQSVVPALLKAGFNVTLISRPGGRAYVPPGDSPAPAQTKEAAYDDQAALTSAMKGHDALVELFNPSASPHQRTIVRAALAAGIQHVLTSEYGMNTFHANAADLPINRLKIDAQKALEEEIAASKAPLTWTGIITSTWYDWMMDHGMFSVNPATRTVTRIGSGNQRISMSRFAICGEAAVAVLRDPQRYRNRVAYFADYTASTNDIIELLRDVIDDPAKPWKIVEVPDVEAMGKEAQTLWDEDTKTGKSLDDRLHSKAGILMLTSAIFDENNRFGSFFEHSMEPGLLKSNDKLRESLLDKIRESEK